MRTLTVSLLALAVGGCALLPPPYEADPTSVYGWDRRQQEITRREAERVRLCQMMNKDSERYERDCRRPGDPE
jgi:hypothetical protein